MPAGANVQCTADVAVRSAEPDEPVGAGMPVRDVLRVGRGRDPRDVDDDIVELLAQRRDERLDRNGGEMQIFAQRLFRQRFENFQRAFRGRGNLRRIELQVDLK